MDIIELTSEYLKTELSIRALEDIKDKIGKDIKEYFNSQESNKQSIILKDDSGNKYKVQHCVRSTVNYNDEKLYNTLIEMDKKYIAKKVINTNVQITNWEEFKKVMIKHGVRINEVINFIQINKKVNRQEFQNSYELGEIDLTQLTNCYEIKTSSYLKLSDVK